MVGVYSYNYCNCTQTTMYEYYTWSVVRHDVFLHSLRFLAVSVFEQKFGWSRTDWLLNQRMLAPRSWNCTAFSFREISNHVWVKHLKEDLKMQWFCSCLTAHSQKVAVWCQCDVRSKLQSPTWWFLQSEVVDCFKESMWLKINTLAMWHQTPRLHPISDLNSVWKSDFCAWLGVWWIVKRQIEQNEKETEVLASCTAFQVTVVMPWFHDNVQSVAWKIIWLHVVIQFFWKKQDNDFRFNSEEKLERVIDKQVSCTWEFQSCFCAGAGHSKLVGRLRV